MKKWGGQLPSNIEYTIFKHTPQRDIKNVCFLLSRLDTLLRPMVLFNPDPVV